MLEFLTDLDLVKTGELVASHLVAIGVGMVIYNQMLKHDPSLLQKIINDVNAADAAVKADAAKALADAEAGLAKAKADAEAALVQAKAAANSVSIKVTNVL